MSNQPTRRTVPLINRPAAAPNHSLGNAVNGALQGMPAMGYNNYPPNYAPMAMMNQFPIQQFYSQQFQSYPPQYPQQYPNQQPFYSPYPQPNQPYPPQQFNQFHQQQQYPPQFAPPLPRTTVDGYSLSSAYTGPTSFQNDQVNAIASSSRLSKPTPLPEPTISIACCLAGCTFMGGKKAVREHEEDRHLIFAPGREPKASTKVIQGARIEGSSISLDSPEAIAAWIADRKKRWPSNKVIEDKETQRAERIAAGLEPALRGGRGRGRGRERGGRGSERGRGRGGAMGARFRETGDTNEPPATKRVKVEASDSSSGSSSDSDDSDDDEPPVASTSKLSTLSLDEERVVGSGKPSIHPSRLVQGDDGEEEVEKKEFQVVCKQWRKGNCALGDECPYQHSLPSNSIRPTKPIRKRPAPSLPPNNPFARADPFAQLEERDVCQSTATILQVIDFLASNNWLRGVELVPGTVVDGRGIEVIEATEGLPDMSIKEEELEEIEQEKVLEVAVKDEVIPECNEHTNEIAQSDSGAGMEGEVADEIKEEKI